MTGFNLKYLKRLKQIDFKLGDLVSWTSHGRCSKTTKSGIIVFIVEPGSDANLAFTETSAYQMPIMGKPRAIKSYLVRVEQIGIGKHRKPKLYFPFTNLLMKI